MTQVQVITRAGGSRAPPGGSTRDRLAAALARTAAGDQAALKLIYEATSAKLFGVCLRILGEGTEAEDVLQEVYVAVWKHAAAFVPERACPITWLVAIARNRSIDRLRANRISRNVEPIDEASDICNGQPGPFEEVQSNDDYKRLMRFLGELDPCQAAAIRGAFLDGLTYNELAQRARVPLGTMKSWIRRGLLRLRACLEP